MATIGIGYGILNPPIGEQIDRQGFKYDKKRVDVFEKDREALNSLRFGSGILTDSMFDRLLEKLHKKVVQHVARKNKLTT